MEFAGKSFLNTRPKHQAAVLSALLSKHGAEVVEFPLLEVFPTVTAHKLKEALGDLLPSDWLMFTSANGVDAVIDKHRVDGFHIAVIGAKTAIPLLRRGIVPDFIAKTANAESMAKEFLRFLKGQDLPAKQQMRVVLLRGRTADESLPRLLGRAGVETRDLIVYDSILPVLSEDKLQLLCACLGFVLDERRIANSEEVNRTLTPGCRSPVDMLVFTSSQAAKNLLLLLGDIETDAARWQSKVFGIPTAVVGPRTAHSARMLGYNVVVTAEEATMESLVSCVRRYYAEEKES
jgi:uroporphyrinogen-III synthase